MNKNILIVDDEESIRWVLGTSLEKSGFKVEYSENGVDAIEKASKNNFSLILLDINMPDVTGFEVLHELRENNINSPIIFITAQNTVSNAIDAIQLGAYDYIIKPFDLDEVKELASKAIDNYESLKKSDIKLDTTSELIKLDEIVGSSKKMLDIYKIIGRVASKDITVLVTGESGTGKELIAKALHSNSLRKNNKLVSINIAAIPKELIESELFGYEKGAFTGAVNSKIGRFEEADGGTLQIDEIGELSIDLQSKLLRVLEEKKIYRLGSEKPIDIDVRIIASTNKDLRNEVKNEKFRGDLLYRLNAITISLPPLRSRKEDIQLLIDHFINKYTKELNIERKLFSDEAKELLKNYNWPGNVRELENIIKKLLLLSPDNIIKADIVENEIKTQNLIIDETGKNEIDENIKDQISKMLEDVDETSSDIYHKIINRFEKQLIELILSKVNGNKKKAASILGINRNTLSKKITELEINAN
ncbi:MAG: response regulator [Candidatus Dadabacteria bacterium]|nr:response regulator [Candidatus Dadabacteria bacterium]NIQ14472.1 response regulator [Candidatus Dadabacteria bacterium]